ncbi:hypothetical protein [Chitinophaga eiseniae]|uniref:hypothetical protein n=1 Tax=Chitinophaga eiseniae TaxID=634771 RepID=UPI001B3B29F7|nr:hypothetical protein [Chitinophaga eiseniae]
MKKKKKVLLTGIALLSAFGVFAQGNGNAGIQECNTNGNRILSSGNLTLTSACSLFSLSL